MALLDRNYIDATLRDQRRTLLAGELSAGCAHLAGYHPPAAPAAAANSTPIVIAELLDMLQTDAAR